MTDVQANSIYRLKNGRTILTYWQNITDTKKILKAAYTDFFRHREIANITNVESIVDQVDYLVTNNKKDISNISVLLRSCGEFNREKMEITKFIKEYGEDHIFETVSGAKLKMSKSLRSADPRIVWMVSAEDESKGLRRYTNRGCPIEKYSASSLGPIVSCPIPYIAAD